MNDTLKPCPFCGQQFFVENAINGGVTYRHDIFCVIGQDQRNEGSIQTWETVECMIEALNKRHEEDVLRGELEDARKELEQLRSKLEEEKDCLRWSSSNAVELYGQMKRKTEELDKANAELTEMKARTCETCGREKKCYQYVEMFPVDETIASCSAWARKEQP